MTIASSHCSERAGTARDVGTTDRHAKSAPPFRLINERTHGPHHPHAPRSPRKAPREVCYQQHYRTSCGPAALVAVAREIAPEIAGRKASGPDPIERKAFKRFRKPSSCGAGLSTTDLALAADSLGFEVQTIVDKRLAVRHPGALAVSLTEAAVVGLPVGTPRPLANDNKARRISFVKLYSSDTGKELGGHFVVVHPNGSVMDPWTGLKYRNIAKLNASHKERFGAFCLETGISLDIRRPG